MKVLIAGGSGNVGSILRRGFGADVEIVNLTRRPAGAPSDVTWDGKTLGDWTKSLEGTDVLINLAGRTVNCRYNAANLREMLESRVDSTNALGAALEQAKNPPKVWLQSSTATIYAHRFDAPNDELTGILGGDEVMPPKWKSSIDIAKAWEEACMKWELPHVRRVLLRSAMTMSPDEGSVFWVLARLARRGLGGRLGDGKQYVSWIHEADFMAAIQFLIEADLDGPVNLAAPGPLPQAEFARTLREAVGQPLGLPTPAWMLEIGTWFMRTESELVLKSRRVVPGRLEKAGFKFQFPTWDLASRDLTEKLRAAKTKQ